MYTECMKISSPPLTKSIFHNLSSRSSCLRLPSLVAGGREAEGRAAGMPAIDVFSKGTTSFLHCLKPQIKFQRFAHHILKVRTKLDPPGGPDLQPRPPQTSTSPCSLSLGTFLGCPQQGWVLETTGFQPHEGLSQLYSLAEMGKIPAAAAQGKATAGGIICVQKVKTRPLNSQ